MPPPRAAAKGADSVSDRSQSSTIREAALSWFVRLHSGDAGHEDHAAFAVWVAATPEHRQEYDRLERVWQDLDHLPDPRPVHDHRRDHRRDHGRDHRRGRRPALAALGLCTLALAVAAGPLTGPFGPLPLGDGVGYTAATGQIRTVALPDGSRLILDAGSRAVVAYSDSRRHVDLREGRVQAVVAADPSRPFEVTAGGLTARALGTAYTVDLRHHETHVAVQESTVEVRHGDRPPHRLAQGQRLTVGDDGSVQPGRASAADIAWQTGHMVFEDVALADVVTDLNRRHPGTVLLLGADLASRRVSGVFDTTRRETVLQALTATLSLRETRLPGGVVLLRQG